MNLTTASPAELDTVLDELEYATAKATAELKGIYARIVSQREIMDEYPTEYYRRTGAEAIAKLEAAIPAANEAVRQALAAERPFHDEYRRRGGWTRAYLVITNGQGHVHRTTACSTCYATTQFVRISEFSGKDEQAIVDAAGERACTVCYASAPVELRLDRKTTIFSKDEKRKQAEREERANKKAQADAEKITVMGYSDFGRKQNKVFKTARAVTNMIASELSSLTWYGPGHPSAQEWVDNIEAGRKALADKGIEYDYEKAMANARKRVVKDGGVAKY